MAAVTYRQVGWMGKDGGLWRDGPHVKPDVADQLGFVPVYVQVEAPPVVRGPECITRSGRPNWCDVHGDRPHVKEGD